MVKGIKGFIAGLLAVLALVAFVGISIFYIVEAFRGFDATMDNAALSYVWNGVAALVGGYVASSFGVQVPSKNTAGTPVHEGAATTGTPATPIQTLGLTASPIKTLSSPKAMSLIGGGYLLVYVLVGVACIGTWIFAGDGTPEIVRALASSFVGLAIPIVTTALASTAPAA